MHNSICNLDPELSELRVLRDRDWHEKIVSRLVSLPWFVGTKTVTKRTMLFLSCLVMRISILHFRTFLVIGALILKFRFLFGWFYTFNVLTCILKHTFCGNCQKTSERSA